jgi:hypothetical protein
MKPNNFHLSHFTELNAEQLHALRLNKEGKLEEQTNSVLSTEEIAALKQIQFLLDDLKFGRDSD